MLYVLYGTDREKIRDESHKMLAGLSKKRPDAQVFRLSEEREALSRLPELIESQGLFEQKHVVVLDFVLEFESVRELLVARAEDIASSGHIFIVLAEKLDAATKRALEKHAHETRSFDEKDTGEKPFNIFSLADAIARRDKKGAWVALQRALLDDFAPEEIHGTVWWQIKTLLRVSRGDTEGMKPFAVTKAKGALNNFSEKELNDFVGRLLSMYHDARAGGPTLDIALEQFVLGL